MKRIAGASWNEAKVDLLLNEVHPGKNESVPDPWYGTEPGYHDVYALINEACEMIIEKYALCPPKGGT